MSRRRSDVSPSDGRPSDGRGPVLGRRRFLGLGGAAVAGLRLGWLPLAARADAPRGEDKILVILMLRGGLDGLSALVPYADRHYAELRRTIRIPSPGRSPGGSIDLDGQFALHPALAPLLPLYRDKRLAFLHAAGSPHETRSHFDAQHYMEIGAPGRVHIEDGFLNRAIAGVPGPESPFRAVAVSTGMPRMLYGAIPALAVGNLLRYRPDNQRQQRMLEALRGLYGDDDGPVRDAGYRSLEAVRVLERVGAPPDRGAGYPRGELPRRLAELARLLKADVGIQVAGIDAGGYDTHVDQGGVEGRLAKRLAELGGGLVAFFDDLGSLADRVVLVGCTEFGRTARENGGGGTDHGHGSIMFACGHGVRGGRVVGTWPGLAPDALFHGRDLAVTTDFRDVFAEVLVGHLGVRDMESVFPGHTVRSVGLMPA